MGRRAALALALLIVGALPEAPPLFAQAVELFTCPMHPDVVSDHPSVCPVCGMELVPGPVEVESGSAEHGATFTCPMHPQVQSDRPGSCPICGMALVEAVAEAPTVAWAIDESGGVVVSGEELRTLLRYAVGSGRPLLQMAALRGVEDPEVLRGLLASDELIVRTAVAYELGLRGDAGSVPALRAAAARQDETASDMGHFAALEALVWLEDEWAVEEVGRLMDSDDHAIRQQAALTAASAATLEPRLRALAEDPDESVRQMALFALAYRGDEDAMTPFVERWEAATYRLHARHDPSGTRSRLRELLESVPLTDPGACRGTPELLDRVAAAAVLSGLDDPAGREHLHRTLDHCAGRSDLDADTVSIVLSALCRGASADDLPHVAPYLDARLPETRIEAASFIGRVLWGIRYTVDP